MPHAKKKLQAVRARLQAQPEMRTNPKALIALMKQNPEFAGMTTNDIKDVIDTVRCENETLSSG
jgi:hypothetical protein